jgi:hypothetical protein
VPSAPVGETDDFLGCGKIYVGGGGAVLPPTPVPDGGTTITDVTDGSDAENCVLGPSAGTSLNNCSNVGCRFGEPIAFSSDASTCVLNTITQAASGTYNAVTGETTISMVLNSEVYLTVDAETPCPVCVNGFCEDNPAVTATPGAPCTTNNAALTSWDCLPLATQDLGGLTISLTPLSTSTVTLTAANGNFCPGQGVGLTGDPGAFGQPTAQYIETRGTPSAPSGGPAVLAYPFCIPPTGNPLVDTVADLPGPGATSLPGISTPIP